MFSFLLNILKVVVTKLVSAGVLNWLQPWLLKVDKWCEDKIGIDLIVQEKKFWEKYPKIEKRLKTVEKNSHPCKELHEFEAYPELIKRIEELEKNIGR